jgi:hypothetical protein
LSAIADSSGRDLYPTGIADKLGVFALVTVDEQDDGWHICFTQDSGPESGSVTDAIEHLANAVYREDCAIVEGRVPRARPSGWRLLRGMCRRRRGVIDPYRLHFYQHLPPAGGRRESFDRVALRFKGGYYRNPRWLGYRVIPDCIQSGRSAAEAVPSEGKAIGSSGLTGQCCSAVRWKLR